MSIVNEKQLSKEKLRSVTFFSSFISMDAKQKQEVTTQGM